MNKKTRVISFVNNKGGSGKSTTAANVAHALSIMGNKVLIIDGDMQLNTSLTFFSEDIVLDIAKGDKNLYMAIKKGDYLDDYIINTPYENLDIIVSSTLMSSIEYELFTKWQREFILKKALQKIKEKSFYDYIIIDSPPTLGGWVMNILCASDKLIIPVEASPWGLFGLANMFEFLDDIKDIVTLDVLGVAITKVDERKNYFKQTLEALKNLEGTYVFKTYIKVDSTIEWSQENSKPLLSYKKSSRSAKEYYKLAQEVDEIACK